MNNFQSGGSAVNLLVFLLLQTLVGCSSAVTVSLSEPISPTLPNYRLGTTYVYSDGSWETVTEITPSLVTWRDNRGNVYSRSLDFTHLPANSQSQTKQVSRRFVPRGDFIVHQDTSLWPLQEGKTAGYTEIVTVRKKLEPEKSYQRSWTCQVNGTERVAALAGDFDTWKIVCQRYNNYQNPSKSKIREIRTWYYAPEISHFVLTERNLLSKNSTRRLELLAILPPLAEFSSSALDSLNQTFQMALEYKKSGETVAWSIPDTSWSGKITPTSTFKLSDGRYSRRYVQKLNFGDGERTYYGLAVRTSTEGWVIPGR